MTGGGSGSALLACTSARAACPPCNREGTFCVQGLLAASCQRPAVCGSPGRRGGWPGRAGRAGTALHLVLHEADEGGE